MNRTFSAILIAGAVCALGTAAFAADDSKPATHTVTLRSGKVLQDAYILDKKPNGITVAYKDGAIFIPFSDMPLEYQQKFGYDAIKSARYEKKLHEQKKAAEKEEEARKEKEAKRKASDDKRYKCRQLLEQQQKVRRLELELEEAQKRLDTTDKTIGENRNSLAGMTTMDTSRVSIESPWGYGGRIRSGKNNAVLTNRLMKENDKLEFNRDKQAQDVIDLKLKLEAAQRSLALMKENLGE